MSFEVLHSCYPPLGRDAFDTFLHDYYAIRKGANGFPLLPGATFSLTPFDLAPFFLPAASGILNSLKLGDTSTLDSKDLEALSGVGNEIVKITLRFRLAGGHHMWSQVWRVRRDNSKPQSFAGPSLPPHSRLVVKLFHDARYYTPEYDDVIPDHESASEGLSIANWLPSPVAAARECVAYSRLRRFQGKYVARILGSYATGLLGREPTIAALLMTEVPGIAFHDALSAWQDNEERIVMIIDAFARTLRRIHKCGVVHRDLKSQHVRVTVDEGNNRVRVQILDFGSAHILPPDFDYNHHINDSSKQFDPLEIDYRDFRRVVWGGAFDEDWHTGRLLYHIRVFADKWLQDACNEERVPALATIPALAIRRCFRRDIDDSSALL